MDNDQSAMANNDKTTKHTWQSKRITLIKGLDVNGWYSFYLRNIQIYDIEFYDWFTFKGKRGLQQVTQRI